MNQKRISELALELYISTSKIQCEKSVIIGLIKQLNAEIEQKTIYNPVTKSRYNLQESRIRTERANAKIQRALKELSFILR